jgi:tetrathionate reductase subunit A
MTALGRRRKLLAAGGLAAFAAGFAPTLSRVTDKVLGKDFPRHKTAGDAPAPEFCVDPSTGELQMNPAQQVSYTMCTGCTSFCGVRVRVARDTGKVLRVTGNPYSPLSTEPHLPMKASVRESFIAVSRFQEKGLGVRSTACGRGNAMLQLLDSPFRVLQPMKRVGPRNSGRWQSISFEQLVKEVVEGGDLFGEGHVEGLRGLRDVKTPIDPAAPDLGPRVNQVAMLTSTNDGREALGRRFMQHAYGTINFVGHGSYCGGSYRSGSGALFGDVKRMPHGKPDLARAEFVLFVGTAPGQAGNPFKRQGKLIARRRSRGGLKYVVVDPVLTHADSRASRESNRWVPIRPGTDAALAMGMMSWMFEHGRIDERFLANPNAEVAAANGEPSFANATHLVIVEPRHPREGRMLRGSDVGMAIAEDQRYKDEDPGVVLDVSGKPIAHTHAIAPAQLYVDTTLAIGAGRVRVKSALQLLREETQKMTRAQYADACGVPAATIEQLAAEFCSHGKKSVAIAHGGMMSGSGFYAAYSVMMLNALVGNVNWAGGLVANGGGFRDDGNGPRYNLETFPGMVKVGGTPLGRNVPYERSSEFAKKKAEGKAYPARAPWFPAAPQLASEWLAAAAEGYPYGLKALLLWSTNPIYGVPGLRTQLGAVLADPKKIPLLVAIDPFINETSAYADYILPDSLLYESWGWLAPWNGVPTKACAARWPVTAPRAALSANGQPIGIETFCLAVAKAMGLSGFGKDAITDMEGQSYALERCEDWYVRGGANVAWLGKEPVPDATDDDVRLAGVDRLMPLLERTLKPEEVRKVAFLYTRGGRYQPAKDALDEEKPEWMANRFKAMLHVWNESVGAARNSMSGKRFVGCPTWQAPAFADGTPMRQMYSEQAWPLQLVSFKSALQNPYSIGAQKLLALKPHNPVIVHPDDAAALGVESGDIVELQTPGGKARATALVHGGVMRGVVAVEHGYGHRELGARAHRIGRVSQPRSPALASGVCLNDLGIADPTRHGKSVWLDAISGAAVRNGLPAKVRRV